MSERGFFGELLHRRVFQYIGLYIAGVWLAIEMGDWLSEQFTMPDRLTTYIFAFMAVMLPSVALFAWTYGAPGKDRASKGQVVFTTLNLVLAALGVLLVPARGPAPGMAVAETAEVAEFELLSSSQRVIAYFLSNDTAEAPDWYAYILPILITEDLQRESPAFSAFTPFDEDALVNVMRQAGFESAMRVPQSLQLQLARRRSYNYFFRGELDDAEDGKLVMRYALHDVGTGEPRVTGEEAFSNDELFAAVDRVSAAVRAELEKRIDDGIQATDLPVSESMSPDLEALRLYTEARLASKLDSDGPRSGELLQQAVEVDPQFAEAHGMLGLFHYLNGRNDLAEAAIDKALRYGFRLSRGSEFRLKINKAAINGDFASARDIARTWTRVEPGNQAAYLRLAELNARTGLDLEEALQAYETVRALNPMAVETLMASATIEQQRGNVDAAESLLRAYLESSPDDAGGLLALAQMKAAKGDYDAALETYREASFLDDRNVEPEVGAISVLMRRGEYAQAEDRVTQLLRQDLTDEEQLRVFTIATSMYTQMGKYKEAIRITTLAEPVMLRAAGPLLTAIQVTAPRIVQEGFIKDDLDPVLAELDELGATLQQPWTDFIAIYKAGLLAAHGSREAFIANLGPMERFVATQPDNNNLQFMADSYRALAAVYDDRPADAVSLISGALERSESSWLAVFLSGEILSLQTEMYDILRRAGEPGMAADGLEDIVEQYPGMAIAHLRLAQAYLELGRDRQARESLDAVKVIWQEADDTLVYLDDLQSVEAALDERA